VRRRELAKEQRLSGGAVPEAAGDNFEEFDAEDNEQLDLDDSEDEDMDVV
jgi:nuclear GTP-binding protein